jgi:hypothetical protein
LSYCVSFASVYSLYLDDLICFIHYLFL